jgi:predicted AAA+ superfamily ATPase
LLLLEVLQDYDDNKLWMKGGFPYPFLYDEYWLDWMNSFTKTYFERDLPNLGFTADSITGERLWTMLAYMHGNLVNYAELGKSLGLSIHTIKKYIKFLENAFLVRTLRPFHINIKKRLVKSPKVYIRDSGLMHYLLGLESYEQLLGNPKLGSSWEGFVIEQIIHLLPLNFQYFFYRTHDGAELDLVLVKGGKPIAGIEIKSGSDPRPSRGNTEAIHTIGLKNNYIIINRKEDYSISSGFRVVDLPTFLNIYLPEIILS